MAESFENSNNILRDWAKDEVQKSYRGIGQVREGRKQKIKLFLFENDTDKIFEQPQSTAERD